MTSLLGTRKEVCARLLDKEAVLELSGNDQPIKVCPFFVPALIDTVLPYGLENPVVPSVPV